MAVSPDGTRAYVTNTDDRHSVGDRHHHQHRHRHHPGRRCPIGVALSPDGTRAYIVTPDFTDFPNSTNEGTLSVIDTATNTVITTLTVGVEPRGVAVSPDGTLVYVTNRVDGAVSVITIASGAEAL